VRFPLADWIDAHADCRYNLGGSGMRGTVVVPRPTAAQVRAASEPELRRRLGELVGAAGSRVFLTHGATEANAIVVAYLARRRGARPSRCRVTRPEYPSIPDVARATGFRLTEAPGPVELAFVSQPRNPLGELWTIDRLAAWSEGARATIVDETFREFTSAASLVGRRLPGLWATGSFTKVYGADDLRVGFAVAPESDEADFARYHGLVADEIPPHSVAGALATLDRRDRLLAEVRAIFERHRALWQRATPGGPTLRAPVAFDESIRTDGDRFARRCLRASVLVCPGSFFGRPGGVRVGLTRRSFPRALREYVRLRDGSAG
jgi:aspartate/methionine/tyrosine aminotransferase